MSATPFAGPKGVTRRVRVTRRIVSKPDHRGRQELLARKGEELSLREAFRRGLREKDLEAIGPGGEVSFEAFRKAAKAKDPEAREEVIATAEQEALDADRRAQQAAEQRRADTARGTQTTWPAPRGGGKWMLSNGSVVGPMDEDEAKAAQDEVDPDANSDPGDGGQNAPADGPKSDKVEDVKEWVGDDAERARTALDAEQAKDEKDQRSTLVEHLEKVAEDA